MAYISLRQSCEFAYSKLTRFACSLSAIYRLDMFTALDKVQMGGSFQTNHVVLFYLSSKNCPSVVK